MPGKDSGKTNGLGQRSHCVTFCEASKRITYPKHPILETFLSISHDSIVTPKWNFGKLEMIMNVAFRKKRWIIKAALFKTWKVKGYTHLVLVFTFTIIFTLHIIWKSIEKALRWYQNQICAINTAKVIGSKVTLIWPKYRKNCDI
jgi:hypothetical protein